MLNVFPALPIVIVLSHMPGRVATVIQKMVQNDAIIKFIITVEPLCYLKLPTISKTEKIIISF